jgi:hypothetical protein
VAFYSRKLSGPELHYSASDIEMLAVISALKEWRCYLEDVPFTIVTDHKPNTYLSESTNIHTTKRRARWLEISCAFDYEWRYRPGRMNVADPVSRAPQHFATPCGIIYVLSQEKRQALPCDCSICCAAYSLRMRPMGSTGQGDASVSVVGPRDSHSTGGAVSLGGDDDTPARNKASGTRRKRKKFKPLKSSSPVISSSEGDISSPHDIVRAHNESVMERMQVENLFTRIHDGYSAAPDVSLGFQVSEPDEDGIRWTKDRQMYIPDHGTLRHDCIEAVHAPTFAGHFGVIRTLRKLKEVYYWPNIRKEVFFVTFIKSCNSCHRVKSLKQKK